MKKFIPYILILVVLFGLIILPNSTQACSFSDPTSCITGTIGYVAGNAFAPALQWIFWFVLKLVALIMGLSGLLLNFVIKTTIIEMSSHISQMTGINIAWKVIRDLMNIVFIFLLVYEGIKLIIGQGNLGSIRKFIGFIVLASLLINFSLFFTKVLIDASNIVTIGLYNSIVANPTATGNTTDASQTTETGLSNAYQQALGLQGFFSKIDLGNSTDNYGPMVANVMGSILFLITAFVFFAVSLLLIIRYIVLIFLLMLSPLAYMGMALPAMKDYTKQWWDSLKGQLLFAPIYMLMTWVILTLINSSGFLGTNPADWAKLQNAQDGTSIGSTVSLFFNFALVIGLSILSLITAKNTATRGSKLIGQATNNLTTYAGGVVMGGTGRLGRNTLGRAGSSIANSDSLKDTAANGNLVTRNLAKFTLKQGASAATSTFDPRANKQFAGLAKTTGINLGKAPDAKKINFQKDLEDRAKKEVAFAKTLKPSDGEMDKIKQQTGHKDLEANEKRVKENQENSTKIANELLLTENRLKDELRRAQEAELNTPSDTTKNEIKNIQEKIKSTQERRQKEIQRQSELKQEIKEAGNLVKESQKELDKVYSNRVDAYANKVENESKAWRYTKNAFKIVVGGPVWGGGIVTTKGDNIEIARKIRKEAKEKDNKTKLAELSSKVAAEDKKAKKEAGEDDGEDEDTTTKPETPPATEPPAAPTT